MVNLYYFGSLWRPREEKGVSLRGVRLPAAAGEKRAGELGVEDLAELEKEVEGKMGGESVRGAGRNAGASGVFPPLSHSHFKKALASSPLDRIAPAARSSVR